MQGQASFLQWAIVRAEAKEPESALFFADRAHLDKLGVGKQFLLPHAYFQVGESAQASRYLPSGKKPPRTEAMDEAMEASYG